MYRFQIWPRAMAAAAVSTICEYEATMPNTIEEMLKMGVTKQN